MIPMLIAGMNKDMIFVIGLLLIVLMIGAAMFFLVRYLKKRAENKSQDELAGEAVSGSYKPTSPRPKDTFIYTISPDKSKEIADIIADSTYWYKDDDITNILATIYKSIRTKGDLSLIVDRLKKVNGKDFYKIIIGNLKEADRLKKFNDWVKKLPEYAKK